MKNIHVLPTENTKQEQMYSEKEVINFLIKRGFALKLYGMDNDYESVIKWFEKYKKK